MKLLPPMQKGYWTVWVATLLFFAAFYALLVPLPLYLTEVGLPDWQVSLILGAFGVASLIGRPLAGAFADGWGRRPVMLFGTGALVVGAVGVSLTTQPLLLFGLRISQAVGYVAFTTAATALVSDLALPQQQGAAMALFGAAANVAMTLTPAAVNAGLGVLTVTGAFWLSGALATIGGVMASRVRQEPPAEKQKIVWRNLLRVPDELRIPMVAAGLFGVGFGAFLQFLPLLTERRGLEPSGLVYTVYGVGIILTRLVTGRLLDRGNRSRMLSLAFLAMAAGLGGFAFAGSRVLLLIAAMLIAVGSGILHPMLIAVHVERVTADERGRASAGFYLGFDLGIGMGTWISSPAFQWFGLTGLYLLAAVSAVLGILPVRLMASRAKQTAQPVAAESK